MVFIKGLPCSRLVCGEASEWNFLPRGKEGQTFYKYWCFSSYCRLLITYFCSSPTSYALQTSHYLLHLLITYCRLRTTNCTFTLPTAASHKLLQLGITHCRLLITYCSSLQTLNHISSVCPAITRWECKYFLELSGWSVMVCYGLTSLLCGTVPLIH